MHKIKLKPNNEKQLTVLVSIFVILQSINFFLRYLGSNSLFTYIFVITSCLFCVLLSDGSLAYRFTQIGMIGTVGADFFLVFLPFQLRIPGMICFCVTQIAYFLRTYFEDDYPIRKKAHLILRVLASIASLTVTCFVLGRRADMLSLLSVFYYAHLILNVVFSFLQFKKLRMLAIGFTLFIISDTLIGFDSLSEYLLIPRGSFVYFAVRGGSKLVMPLYLAAQTLIPLSLVKRKRKSLQKDKTNE